MHDLITKYFEGELTATEKTQLFVAMEHDPELKREFMSVQNLRALTSWVPAEEDTPSAIGKLLEFKQSRKKKSLSVPYRHIFGYAATACVAVFSTWFLIQNLGLMTVEQPVAYEQFSTPSGQRAQLTLHDGTVVWLNARSTLRYPNRFDKKSREVELDGEAFFDVKRNAAAPFIVSTGKANIKVLGTKFNVFAYKGSTEFSTSLVSGAVKVYFGKDDTNALQLKSHESATIVDNHLVKSRYDDNADFLLWREGIYAFDDVPFNEIIKKLELYYDVTIIQQNKKLEQFRFSGKFRQRDGVESVLKTLQKVFYFSFKKDDELNRITII